MKKLTIITIVLLILTGCQTQKEEDTLNISVSFYPLSYFTQEIVGKHGTVFNVLDKGSDAHDYEPSIQDRIQIEESDIFIHNGFHLEHWVDKTLDSIKNDNLVVVETSFGIDPILRGQHPDPHIWLDPFLAATQIDNIYEAIIYKDPEHLEYYEKRYLDLKTKMHDLQASFNESLIDAKGKSIVLEHEIFSYISSRYGFKQVSISGILPEGEPSIQQLSQVVEYINEHEIKHMLLSKYDATKVIDTISKEADVNVLLIDSMEIGNGDFDYFKIMKANLESIKEALQDE